MTATISKIKKKRKLSTSSQSTAMNTSADLSTLNTSTLNSLKDDTKSPSKKLTKKLKLEEAMESVNVLVNKEKSPKKKLTNGVDSPSKQLKSPKSKSNDGSKLDAGKPSEHETATENVDEAASGTTTNSNNKNKLSAARKLVKKSKLSTSRVSTSNLSSTVAANTSQQQQASVLNNSDKENHHKQLQQHQPYQATDQEGEQQEPKTSETTRQRADKQSRKMLNTNRLLKKKLKDKNKTSDRLDNLVDSLSHIYCTDNESRSHKMPGKFSNMIVSQQIKRARKSSTELSSSRSSSQMNTSNEQNDQVKLNEPKRTKKTNKKNKKQRVGEQENELMDDTNGEDEVEAANKEKVKMQMNDKVEHEEQDETQANKEQDEHCNEETGEEPSINAQTIDSMSHSTSSSANSHSTLPNEYQMSAAEHISAIINVVAAQNLSPPPLAHPQPIGAKPTLMSDMKVNSKSIGHKVSANNQMDLYKLLEKANLAQYYNAFTEQGGDDLNQLCEADDDEFKEIVELVGMASKPLHVKRLRKALDEHKSAKFAKSDANLDEGRRSTKLESHGCSTTTPAATSGSTNQQSASNNAHLLSKLPVNNFMSTHSPQLLYLMNQQGMSNNQQHNAHQIAPLSSLYHGSNGHLAHHQNVSINLPTPSSSLPSSSASSSLISLSLSFSTKSLMGYPMN